MWENKQFHLLNWQSGDIQFVKFNFYSFVILWNKFVWRLLNLFSNHKFYEK